MRRLLLGLLVLATACGGGISLDDYFGLVEEAAQQFDSATGPLTAGVDLDSDIAALAEKVDPSDPAQVEQFLEDALLLAQTQTDLIFAESEVAVTAFVAELEAIEAPAALEAEHSNAVSRGQALVEEIPQIRAALDAAATLEEFADALSRSPLEVLSDAFTASCQDLQAVADGEGIAVDLGCG